MTTSTINIADLINLLDKQTLDALSQRLHAVLDGNQQETQSPEQLLFEFIDAGIVYLENEAQVENTELANSILCEIEK